MKAFRDLEKGDAIYEVYSSDLAVYEVEGHTVIDNTSMRIPVKSKVGEGIMYINLPKSKGRASDYKFSGIYRGFYTSRQVAEEVLRTNLVKFKENAEARVKEAQEALLKAQEHLKEIEKKINKLS